MAPLSFFMTSYFSIPEGEASFFTRYAELTTVWTSGCLLSRMSLLRVLSSSCFILFMFFALSSITIFNTFVRCSHSLQKNLIVSASDYCLKCRFCFWHSTGNGKGESAIPKWSAASLLEAHPNAFLFSHFIPPPSHMWSFQSPRSSLNGCTLSTVFYSTSGSKTISDAHTLCCLMCMLFCLPLLIINAHVQWDQLINE